VKTCLYLEGPLFLLIFTKDVFSALCSLVLGMFVCIERQGGWTLPLVNDNVQMIASQLPLLPSVTLAPLLSVSQDKWYRQPVCKKMTNRGFSEDEGDVAVSLARLRHSSCMGQSFVQPMVQLLQIYQSQ